MTLPPVKILGILGGGVIGAGWAARACLCGLDVIVYDVSPNVKDIVTRACDNAERAYRKLTVAPLTNKGELIFTDNLADLSQADFIQESLPERPDLKISVLKEISEHVDSHIIIGSSTSGLSPSLLQSDMHAPERFVVGHPFNPVYLMPLVEVCGGDKTTDDTKQKAMSFYESLGMHGLLLQKEVSGFIADRLMEALWREALWMVHDGVADVADIDDALRYGPGLRWSFMGSFLTYRLAGGEGGMRHFLAHFAPSLQWDWTRLQAPEWSDELSERIAAQSDKQAGDKSLTQYEHLRDDCLVSVMQGLRKHDYGAGSVLARFEKILFDGSHQEAKDIDESQPLQLHSGEVLPEWLDYNGHMTESRYLQVFGDAADSLYRFVGCDSQYHKNHGSFYTAETHIRHLQELPAGEAFYITTQILGLWDKRIHFFHNMYRQGDNQLAATCEQMAVHVFGDRAATIEKNAFKKLQDIYTHHEKCDKPDGAGRFIGQAR